MLNYAIIGFGGLGKVHFDCMEEVVNTAGSLQLVALCDVEESAFAKAAEMNIGKSGKALDLSAYRLYNDTKEMFTKEKLDFVVTALPTYLHEKIAVEAMEHRIHVFSEKPMAINYEQAENMLKQSKENNVQLMIGQCLRYMPAYVELKNMVDSKKYGEVVRADFSRLSGTPVWSWQNWMQDEEKSGAAILDLHVHDVDYIHWLFGMPKSVTSYSTNAKTPHDSICTAYDFGDDKIITAKADWGFPNSYPFAAAFTVRFKNATAVFKDGSLCVYHENGEPTENIALSGNAYANEVIDFVRSIREGKNSEINPPEASLGSLKIALAERMSADTKKTVEL